MPIAVYPGITLTGAKVLGIVTDAQIQFEAQVALHERYRTPFALSAMDLSAEAEAFGCHVHLSETEVPSILGRRMTSLREAEQLPVPKPGDRRTAVYLETVRRLKQLPARPLVLGGCIGPFSLAARLVGVSEAMELTLTEPDIMRAVLEKSAQFLTAYAKEFKAAGAAGVIMAEPAAGLLSPRSLSDFSSAYIRQIVAATGNGQFAFILHNCAAKALHLPAILKTGLTTFHFGAPMDLIAALGQVPSDVVLCGNLDPSAMFCQATPDETFERTTSLLSATAPFRNYVISSGCDLPPNTSLANLDAFYDAVKTLAAGAVTRSEDQERCCGCTE
jgi:uroporphyrinogen decarboxylase